MFKNTNEIILIIAICLILFWFIYQKKEGFDKDTVMFVPVGARRYGLRGDRLRRSHIARTYIRPDRHIRLSQTNNPMWESDTSPVEQGMIGCRQTPCPVNTNEYDASDKCWVCGDDDPHRCLRCGYHKSQCNCGAFAMNVLARLPDVHSH